MEFIKRVVRKEIRINTGWEGQEMVRGQEVIIRSLESEELSMAILQTRERMQRLVGELKNRLGTICRPEADDFSARPNSGMNAILFRGIHDGILGIEDDLDEIQGIINRLEI